MDSAPLSTVTISPVLGEVETLGGVRIFENPASGFPQTVRQRGVRKAPGGVRADFNFFASPLSVSIPPIGLCFGQPRIAGQWNGDPKT